MVKFAVDADWQINEKSEEIVDLSREWMRLEDSAK